MDELLKEIFYTYQDTKNRKKPTKEKDYDKINEIEERLLKNLTGENKQLFIAFSNAYGELCANAVEEAFVDGAKKMIKLQKTNLII